MARSLSQLSPFGPIFGKELRITARRKRTYWLRFVYLATMFLFLLLVYTSVTSRVFVSSGSVAEKARQAAELGQSFFHTFALFSVIAMPLIAPILTSTAVNSERLGKTLNVLLMTPITSWQIVSGKLFSRLLVALTLLALSLPVLAVVRLLGGVELDSMIAVLCLCTTVALAGAAVGLFYSTLINRAYAVILISYFTLFLAYGVIPLVIGLIIETNRTPYSATSRRWFFDFMSLTNPFYSVGMVILRGGRRFMPTAFPWWSCALYHLGVAAVLVPFTGRILRRRALKEEDPPSAGLDSSAINTQVTSATIGQENAAAENRRPRRFREVGNNPVLWRELRRPLIAKRWQRIVGGIASIGLLLLTYILIANQYRNELTSTDTHVGYGLVFYSLILLLTCVLSGTAISAEKESDTWTLLLATPLKGADIVRGKIGGILRRTAWPVGLFCGHLLIFALAGILSWTAVVVVLWVTVTFSSVWIALGLSFSLKLKNNTFAVVATLLMPVCAFIIVPVLLLIAGNLLLDNRSDRLADVVFYYLPYIYIIEAIDGLPGKENWSWDQATSKLEFPNSRHTLTPRDFVWTALVVGLLYLLLAALILWRIGRRFDRIVARAPQSAPLPPVEMTAGLHP